MSEFMMTPSEVAVFLQISRATIYRMAKMGELPNFCVTGKRRTRVIRFLRADVEKFVQLHMRGGAK